MEALENDNSLIWQKGTKGNWTRNLNLFLIEKRIALDDLYFKKRDTRNKGWREILNEFHKLGFKHFGVYNIQKRWSSMYQTYKDYKKILTTNEVSWPYYQILDEYFIKNQDNLVETNPNEKLNSKYSCQLCRNENKKTFLEEIDAKLLNQIEIYLHIKFQSDVAETSYICNMCNVKLSQFHIFYLKCRRINETFLCNEIKIENEDLVTTNLEPSRKYEKINLTLEDILDIKENDSETEDLEFLEDILDASLNDDEKSIEVIKIENFESDQVQIKKKKSKKTVYNKPKSKRSSKKRDVKIDQTPKVKTECDVCGGIFLSQQAFINHMKYVHNEKLKCPIENCEKTVHSQQILKIHITRDHFGKSCWICKHCGRGFNYKHLMEVHEKNHFNIKDVPCDICGEKFVSSSHLKRHKDKVHHEVFFYCSKCPKKFLSRAMLVRHEVVHSGKRDFQCEKCHKAFITKRELKVHGIRVHEGGTHSHSCTFCFKSFNSSTGKKLHERIHTGERPYKCSICDKAYTCLTHLNRHVKIIHENKQ